MVPSVPRVVARSLICLTLLAPVPLNAQTTITLPSRDVPLSAQLERQYSIGRMEGERWETFGGTLQVEFGRDGSLYVLDRDNSVVHSFDPRGAHRWSAGRAGAGPGELSGLTHMAVLPDGAVVIADYIHGRPEHFDASGRHSSSVSLPAQMRPRRIYVAGNRAVWLVPGSSGAQQESLPILRVTLDGEATVAARVAVTGASVRREGDLLRRELPPTFSPQLRATSAGTGLAVVDGVQYRILLNAGQPTLLERSLPPRPVTTNDRDVARERVRLNAANARPLNVNGFQVLQQEPAAVEEQIRQMRFAEHMPLIVEMRGAPDGTLWVARPGRVAFEPGPIDVVGADSRYIGTLASQAVPAAIGPEGLVAVVEHDDMEVPRIRVHRLVLRR